MKKEFMVPSLNMKSFNKELILQDSAVPTITNEQAAVNALNSASVDGVSISKVAVISL